MKTETITAILDGKRYAGRAVAVHSGPTANIYLLWVESLTGLKRLARPVTRHAHWSLVYQNVRTGKPLQF